MTRIAVHPSALADWMACPMRRLHAARSNLPPDTEYAGTVVGNRVHQRITGHDPGQKPAFVRYDGVTRNQRELDLHTDRITSEVLPVLEALVVERWEVDVHRTLRIGGMDVRVQGSIDLVAIHEGRRCIIDLKVGKRLPDVVWQQLAAYAWLAEDLDAEMVGLIWARRGNPWDVQCEFREITEALTAAGAHACITVGRWMQSGQAPYMPGALACAHCSLDSCPVRATPSKENP